MRGPGMSWFEFARQHRACKAEERTKHKPRDRASTVQFEDVCPFGLFLPAGRLEEQKGVDIVLAALKKLPKSAPVQAGGR